MNERKWTIFGVSIVVIIALSATAYGLLRKGENEKIDEDLKRRYEQIMLLVELDKYDEASFEITKLVHPSNEMSKHSNPDSWDNYTYSGYWEMKRNELRALIKESRDR